MKIYVINLSIYTLSISLNICNYILHKNLSKIIQEPHWPFVAFWNLISLFYLLPFVFICCTTRCHSLPLIVICCQSLSFVVPFAVTRCTTRCHSLQHSLSLVTPLIVICCHSLHHSWSFFVTRCHSLPLDGSFVCLCINNLNQITLWHTIYVKRFDFRFLDFDFKLQPWYLTYYKKLSSFIID